MTPLADPIILTDRAARSFGSKAVIVVENTSAAPRTVMMLVGSDLPKAAQNSKLVVKAASGKQPAK